MLTQKPRIHCFNILCPNDVNGADVEIKSFGIVIVDGARIRWCKYTTTYRSIVAILQPIHSGHCWRRDLECGSPNPSVVCRQSVVLQMRSSHFKHWLPKRELLPCSITSPSPSSSVWRSCRSRRSSLTQLHDWISRGSGEDWSGSYLLRSLDRVAFHWTII
jgi:hypothetical protein